MKLTNLKIGEKITLAIEIRNIQIFNIAVKSQFGVGSIWGWVCVKVCKWSNMDKKIKTN